MGYDAEFFPFDGLTQEYKSGVGKLFVTWVMAIMGDVSMQD